ncbi:hypothetical protein CHH83_01905 [Bacillus sp. 7586-K]|nr:hypothetical protein CHH83_01905 [Bacillus sp. 7586-K]
MKLLEITDEALEQYRTTVRGNENITYDQAQRKLTRNVILVKDFAPERIKRSWLTLGKNFAYGNLHIIVRSGKIIKIVNHKGRKQDSWNPPKHEYIKLCKLLGIEDNKYKKKKFKKVTYK